MKTQIRQFSYTTYLPGGQPVNLQFSFVQDDNYPLILKAFRGLLSQAATEVDEELGSSKSN